MTKMTSALAAQSADAANNGCGDVPPSDDIEDIAENVFRVVCCVPKVPDAWDDV